MTGDVPREVSSLTVDQSVAEMSQVAEAYRWENIGIAQQVQYLDLNPSYEDHLVRSRRAISETAAIALRQTPKAEDRTAIVLGAGGCFDIPLEEIVAEFDKTTLVDVDFIVTDEVLSTLPTNLLKKVSRHRADITGNVTKLSNIIDQAKNEPDFPGFISTATNLLSSFKSDQQQVKLGGNYSFVCSQLVMSQLFSIPQHYFSSKVHERYGKAFSMRPDGIDGPLMNAFNELNIQTQLAHVAQLAHLVNQNGTVHFADTVGSIHNDRLYSMVSPNVTDTLTTLLSPIAEMKAWEWINNRNAHFLVGAQALRHSDARYDE